MSANKNVHVNGVWSIPWLLIGAIMYFGTDASNTWWGIHTKHAGGIILVVSLIGVGLMLAFLAVVLVLVALASKSNRNRW